MARVVLKKKLMPSYTEYLERGSYAKEKTLGVKFEGTPAECLRWFEQNPDEVPRYRSADPVFIEIEGDAEEKKRLRELKSGNPDKPEEKTSNNTDEDKLPF